MAIERYENVEVDSLTFGVNDVGEYTTTSTVWFTTRARIKDVRNSLEIDAKYRVYQDLVNMTFNYPPNIKAIVDRQELYAVKWRGYEWRLTDVRESNDRMSVTFLAYRNDPSTRV